LKDFDGLDYTRNAILEELSLIERHARDGSAITAGCSCIEEKHLLVLSGLASEGVTLVTDQDEKDYYIDLAERMRAERQRVLQGDFGKKYSHSVKCEAKVAKCIQQGGSEEECRVKVHCH